MKEHLKQQVSKLLSHELVILETNGVVELVRLFNQVGTQRLVRLRGVPFAPRAEIAHQRQSVVERVCACLVHGCVIAVRSFLKASCDGRILLAT